MTRIVPGTVRIIGGRWRGSKLPVADMDGLRPTADRVRETLFNWLQPMLHGARVLDLFAGSGALGLEAASRGAAQVVLIERLPSLAADLRAHAERLGRHDSETIVEVVNDDAMNWLAGAPAGRFDLAFVDPPFAADLWLPAMAALEPWLADDGWLYVEAPREHMPAVAGRWRQHRRGHTRDVSYALYRRDAVTLDSVSAEQDPARA